MKYYVYKLKFLTPVHFGNSAGGGKLDKVALTCSADTYFSALCQEAANLGRDVRTFAEYFKNGLISISSLFPYFDNPETKESELYLPKPLILGKRTQREAQSYQDVKKEATALKKLKKSLYIRGCELENFYKASMNGDRFVSFAPSFASEYITTRVSMRGENSLPYHVGSYIFREDAGLYFVLGFEDENAAKEFRDIAESLGYSGIGGKRSSGFGKYEIVGEPIDLSSSDGDFLALYKMLENDDAKLKMCIAPLCPTSGQAASVKSGNYKIIKRSGFVTSGEDNLKRSTFYMLAEGSCFSTAIQGEMKELKIPGFDHFIYRNGLGMFVGVGNND